MRPSILVILVVIIVAITTTILVLANLQRQSGIPELKVVVVDFAYRVDTGEPVIKLRANEEVRIIFENRGRYDHEFLLVRDKDAVIREVGEALRRGVSDAELDRLKAGMAFAGIRYEVEPGSVTIFKLKLVTPGVYYFLCLETEPGSIPHAERGEFGRIIVEG
jgi:uncharacterized cupredoxin-like copper-binding protein